MITELYQRTLKELTSSNRAWMDFLKTAAFQYKYPFSDQVLIHAQRQGAVACTELEVWNEKFGRWVNTLQYADASLGVWVIGKRFADAARIKISPCFSCKGRGSH